MRLFEILTQPPPLPLELLDKGPVMRPSAALVDDPGHRGAGGALAPSATGARASKALVALLMSSGHCVAFVCQLVRESLLVMTSLTRAISLA